MSANVIEHVACFSEYSPTNFALQLLIDAISAAIEYSRLRELRFFIGCLNCFQCLFLSFCLLIRRFE